MVILSRYPNRESEWIFQKNYKATKGSQSVPYATEIIAIVAPVMFFLTATFTLRLTYLRGRIEGVDSNVTLASNEIKRKLSLEIKKGKKADIEEVVNLANTLASIDRMHDNLKKINRIIRRGFFLDLVSIGLLVVVAVMSMAETEFDPLSTLFIGVVVYFILIVVSSFAGAVRDLFKLEDKLKNKGA